MTPSKSRNAPPRASAMIESLRGVGYSTATAIADIIDNSIAAGADCIDVRFSWSTTGSTIAILDNGRGMDDAALEIAMRLGAISPLAARSEQDLGRFGLGLKTASFSQCRRLTVASRSSGNTSCLRWDLDLLAASADGEWALYEGPANGSETLLQPLVQYENGTIVVWEILDRIVTLGSSEQDFLDLIDRVEQHLSMVFHRYLEGNRIAVRINGRTIPPWDPFLPAHPATWSSPIEPIKTPYGNVEVQCHVLPHKDRLDGRDQSVAAGPNGWTAQQGFYVYRNERLLVAGSWLGLGRGRPWTKGEEFRLARIRLDFTNESDSHWGIDVRKSLARPPVPMRERLTRLAEDTRERARRVFAHRGQAIRSIGKSPLIQAWQAEHVSGTVRYRIDRTHPLVRAVLDDAGGAAEQVLALLRVLEETIPVQRIWLDTAESKETPRTAFAGQPTSEISAVLSVFYRNLVLRRGMLPALARETLLGMEPFNQNPELVMALPDSLPEESDA